LVPADSRIAAFPFGPSSGALLLSSVMFYWSSSADCQVNVGWSGVKRDAVPSTSQA